MRKQIAVLAVAALMLLGLGQVSPAHADAAPPELPPGSSVTTGKYQTNVQMVSENVLMTISDYTPPVVDPALAQPFTRGHVEATFNMQNQGDTAESFDVWFPMSNDTGYGDDTIKNFHAWVDGIPAAKIGQQKTKAGFDGEEPWATWPATFPPGKPVTLRVSYDTYGRGFPPHATFSYILHTGAGWYGTIGEGTVTFRLPYDVNDLNTATSGDLWAFEGYPFLAGGPFTVSGRDVIWHFTNLEPTKDNDIALTVLQPSVWRKIAAARAFADANPKSEPAQLALARAAQQGLSEIADTYIEDIGNTQKVVLMASDAYEAALSLDPNNADIYSEYLTFLEKDGYIASSLRERYTRALERLKQLDPNDAKTADFQRQLDRYTDASTQSAQDTQTATIQAPHEATQIAQWDATNQLYATLSESVRLGVIPPPTPTATYTREQLATEFPALFPLSETPTATPTATPSATASPVFTPSPPVKAAASDHVQDWTGLMAVALVVVIVGAAWLGRRMK